MKYIKIAFLVFGLTLVFAFTNAKATDFKGYSGFKIKNLSQSTTVDSQEKFNYGYQSAKKISAVDSLSGDDRGVAGMVTNSSWKNLTTNTVVKWDETLTYFAAANYTHYVKLTKSTLSSASYYGFWYWDVEM